MLERARALQDQIVAWRREIHIHPELRFQEHRPAKLVAGTLQVMGLVVETGVGKTGVVGHLGEGRPAVGIRADMDALVGTGCHGAHPHTGVAPIFILAQVVNAIHGIRARRINPLRRAVISIYSVRAGAANNIIPDEVEINGTIRSHDDETRQQLWGKLEKALAVA